MIWLHISLYTMCMLVPMQARRGHRAPGNQRYRQLSDTRCWGLSLRPLEEKQVLLTTEQVRLGSGDVLEGDLWTLILPSLHGPLLLSPLPFFPVPSLMLRQGSMTKPEWCSCNYNLKYVFLPPKLFVPCIFDTAKENQLTLKQRTIF